MQEGVNEALRERVLLALGHAHDRHRGGLHQAANVAATKHFAAWQTLGPNMTEAASLSALMDPPALRIALVTFHKGRLHVAVAYSVLHVTTTSATIWWRQLHELAAVAAAYPSLSVDFLLNLSDRPLNLQRPGGDHRAWAWRAKRHGIRPPRLPVFSFSRTATTWDIPVPHYYMRPERVCASAGTQSSLGSRKSSLVARFSYFCPAHVTRAHRPCQRTFFSLLGQHNRTAVASSGVAWDVAPLNRVLKNASGYSRLVQPRPRISFPAFAQHRYVLATDGWVAAGVFANLLALGSVVFKPSSPHEMVFETLLAPFGHFVPLWEEGEGLYTISSRLAWLEGEPQLAQRIASAGRDIACNLLGRQGRYAMWHALLHRYAGLAHLSVDNEYVKRRKRLHGHVLDGRTPRDHLIAFELSKGARCAHIRDDADESREAVISCVGDDGHIDQLGECAIRYCWRRPAS